MIRTENLERTKQNTVTRKSRWRGTETKWQEQIAARANAAAWTKWWKQIWQLRARHWEQKSKPEQRPAHAAMSGKSKTGAGLSSGALAGKTSGKSKPGTQIWAGNGAKSLCALGAPKEQKLKKDPTLLRKISGSQTSQTRRLHICHKDEFRPEIKVNNEESFIHAQQKNENIRRQGI
jgi:hypothetical protein